MLTMPLLASLSGPSAIVDAPVIYQPETVCFGVSRQMTTLDLGGCPTILKLAGAVPVDGVTRRRVRSMGCGR